MRASDDLLTYDLSAPHLTPDWSRSTRAGAAIRSPSARDARTHRHARIPARFLDAAFRPNPRRRERRAALPDRFAAGRRGQSARHRRPSPSTRCCRCWRSPKRRAAASAAASATPVLLWDVANNRSVGRLSAPEHRHQPGLQRRRHEAGGRQRRRRQHGHYVCGMSARRAASPRSKRRRSSTSSARRWRSITTGRAWRVGYPDGSFSLWQIADGSGTQQYSVQLFDKAASEVVSAVAISPDGSLIAVAGGVPFSGGLTGQEKFPIFLLDAATGSDPRPARRTRQPDPRPRFQPRRSPPDQRGRQFGQVLGGQQLALGVVSRRTLLACGRGKEL